jgi:hypothetical protein
MKRDDTPYEREATSNSLFLGTHFLSREVPDSWLFVFSSLYVCRDFDRASSFYWGLEGCCQGKKIPEGGGSSVFYDGISPRLHRGLSNLRSALAEITRLNPTNRARSEAE